MHAAAAVGAELEAEEAASLDGLDDHRARAVAEQDAASSGRSKSISFESTSPPITSARC